jgi:hypothetical protein
LARSGAGGLVGLRGRLRRLEREAEHEMIIIPQKDGTVKRFPASEGMVAYMNWMDRLGAGEDAPPEHPLIAAVGNSSESKWQNSFWAANDPDEWVKPIPDLSE